MTDEIYFDDSFNALRFVVESKLGSDFLSTGRILRDSSGRLAFFSGKALGKRTVAKLTAALKKALGPYGRRDRIFVAHDEIGAQSVLEDASALPVREEGKTIAWVVDRRIVGADWLIPPRDEVAIPPRLVFASLKGGVGRTTALAVSAADMARRGLNVLVVDMDLEAPGIGYALLDSERMPRFGVVDYLVENGLHSISGLKIAEFVGTSALTESGRVDVVPAFGKVSESNPQNLLAKLSRAMTEDVNSDGGYKSVAVQLSDLIASLVQRENYDRVLIDCRAGLAELASGPMLALGATVLFFGTAQPQTIAGYNALFAHLSSLANRDPLRASWRRGLKMVYAKATFDKFSENNYRQAIYELFSNHLYDEADLEDESESFNFGPDDPDAPHWPLMIPFDHKFVDWNPIQQPTQLTAPFYESIFRPFLNGIEELLLPDRVGDK